MYRDGIYARGGVRALAKNQSLNIGWKREMAGRRKEGSDPVLRPASDKLDPSGFIVKHWLGSIDERCSDGPVIAGKTLTSATESGGSSARDSLLPLPTELESTFPRPHRVPIFLLLSLDSSFHAPTLSDNDRYKSTALILSHRVDRVSFIVKTRQTLFRRFYQLRANLAV